MDGTLGDLLSRKIEARATIAFSDGSRTAFGTSRTGCGRCDAGRHGGMRIRVLPSKVQTRTFELIGAVPMPMDLTQAIAMIKRGEIDAQENPLSNTVTYGVHKFHRFHSLTNHFYISRPIFVHRDTFDAWPQPVKSAMQTAVQDAVTFQRGLHEREEEEARQALASEGCEIAELTPAEHALFAAAVAPLREEAQAMFGKSLLGLATSADEAPGGNFR